MTVSTLAPNTAIINYALFMFCTSLAYISRPGGGCEVLFSPGGGCEVLFSPCLSVCLCVCPASILVFYFSAIRRDIELKFIQDTHRVVVNSPKHN